MRTLAAGKEVPGRKFTNALDLLLRELKLQTKTGVSRVSSSENKKSACYFRSEGSPQEKLFSEFYVVELESQKMEDERDSDRRNQIVDTSCMAAN